MTPTRVGEEGRKILLVGEANPYGEDPKYALFPQPRRAAGNRLRLIFGLTDLELAPPSAGLPSAHHRARAAEFARVRRQRILAQKHAHVAAACSLRLDESGGGKGQRPVGGGAAVVGKHGGEDDGAA